jgi:hypothetical protein
MTHAMPVKKLRLARHLRCSGYFCSASQRRRGEKCWRAEEKNVFTGESPNARNEIVLPPKLCYELGPHVQPSRSGNSHCRI